MKSVGKNELGQTTMEMPSGRHPESHFEHDRTHIEPADNGGYTVTHHKRLKRKFEGMRHMEGSYREPEKHVFTSADEMHAHLQTIFKGGKKAVAAEKKEMKAEKAEEKGEE